MSLVVQGANPTTHVSLRSTGELHGSAELAAAVGFELRGAAPIDLRAAKYTPDQLHKMLKDGTAFPNADGSPSFPVGDREDLLRAIHATGRSLLQNKEPLRKFIIGRAKALNASRLIPANWNADGSVKRSAAVSGLGYRTSAAYLDEIELQVRATKARRRPVVSERDRQEIIWRSGRQAASSPLAQAELQRLMLSRAYADQERAQMELRRRASADHERIGEIRRRSGR